MLGTCNPSHTWVYSKFYKPNKENKLPANRKFIQSLPTDNEHLPETYLESLLELDDSSKQRLYFGNWEYSDDPTKLCEYDVICDMFTNDHVDTGNKYISADLAMQGRDKFVAGYWDGMVCTVSIDKDKCTAREIEMDLKNLKTLKGVGNTNIVADSDGLGAYLESYIKNIKTFHGGSSPVNKNEFGNLKDECAFKLAEMINNRTIKVICTSEQEEEIKSEISICLKRDNINIDKKKIIKKDKMKEFLGHSPDYLDMLLMKMLFHVKNKNVFFI
jgi:hypothetical protein